MEKYIVIQASDISTLTKGVNEMISKGYEVVGGMNTVFGSYGVTGNVHYYQPMILTK